MTCATLKRSLELDPLHPSTSTAPSKRRRYAAEVLSSPSSISTSTAEKTSPFAAVTPSMTSDQISIHIREEMKRLSRRRQLFTEDKETIGDGESGPRSPGSSATNGNLDTIGLLSPSAYHQSNKDKDKPLFTFRQVGLICERMMKEREDKLKEMYSEVLSTKLAEQYDTFVKFTYDQMQKQYKAASVPSYLS